MSDDLLASRPLLPQARDEDPEMGVHSQFTIDPSAPPVRRRCSALLCLLWPHSTSAFCHVSMRSLRFGRCVHVSSYSSFPRLLLLLLAPQQNPGHTMQVCVCVCLNVPWMYKYPCLYLYLYGHHAARLCGMSTRLGCSGQAESASVIYTTIHTCRLTASRLLAKCLDSIFRLLGSWHLRPAVFDLPLNLFDISGISGKGLDIVYSFL